MAQLLYFTTFRGYFPFLTFSPPFGYFRPLYSPFWEAMPPFSDSEGVTLIWNSRLMIVNF